MLSRTRFAVIVAFATMLMLVPLGVSAASEAPAPEAAPPEATAEVVAPDAAPAAAAASDLGRPTPPPYATDPAKLSPMMREIVAAWEASQVAVAAVEQQMAATTDPMAAMALQRQIEDLREQVEVQMLRIQARYARQEGRLDAADEIETAIAEMTAPRPRGVPVDRPLPDDRSR